MSKVNWVLAGIGDIARKRVIPAIQAEPRSTLYGFVTRDAAKARQFPGAKTWATVEEAVADPAVDAVYIALPVAFHANAAITGSASGQARVVREAHGYQLCAGGADGGRGPRIGAHVRRLVLSQTLSEAPPCEAPCEGGRHRPAAAGRGQLPQLARNRGPRMAARPGAGRRRAALRHCLASHRCHELPLRQGGARLRPAVERRASHGRGGFCDGFNGAARRRAWR